MGEEITADVEQEILKVFEWNCEEQPLTTAKVAAEIPLDRVQTRAFLEAMESVGQVGVYHTGKRSVWWANLAPRLAPELQVKLQNEEPDEWVELGTTSHEELTDKLNID